MAGDLRRGAFALSDGEEVFVDFEAEFCWEVAEAEGGGGCWLVGTALERCGCVHGYVLRC